MTAAVGLLLICAAFLCGVWLGFHAAHIAGTASSDLSSYLTSSPTVSAAAVGAGRPAPETPIPGAGRPTKPTTK